MREGEGLVKNLHQGINFRTGKTDVQIHEYLSPGRKRENSADRSRGEFRE